MISSVTQSPVFESRAKVKINGKTSLNSFRQQLDIVAKKMGKKLSVDKLADKQLDLPQDALIICGVKKLARRGNNVYVTIMDAEKTPTKLIEALGEVFGKDKVVACEQL